MRRWIMWAAVLGAWLVGCSGAALLMLPAGSAAAAQASWQYAPADAPAPPTGVSPSPFPTDVGTVGDIEFWSPNEGLLITGGTTFVPAGLYAYDGLSWHQLSTVCGSAEGRIAFAGPDEWWTISDQRPGLALGSYGTGTFSYDAVSLCHFVGGQVVGSYAVPVGETDSYPEMDAAACTGPDDCWFAGGFSGTTSGAFHLFWNGQTLTEIDNTDEAHAVSSMAVDNGQVYEGVTIAPTDTYSTDESQTAPALIHSLDPTDLSDPFDDVLLANNACTGFCPTLPQYNGVTPSQLGGWMLSSDNGTSGDPAGPGQMWALAAPTDVGTAHPFVLRYTNADESWRQIVGAPGISWPSGQSPAAIAAVPGQDAAWVTLSDGSYTAELEELSSSDGGSTWSVGAEQRLGPDQNVGDLGGAGPIACPAANDCWLATSDGWLFHWTDGTSYGQTGDPVFNGGIGVITYRPADDGVPDVPGLGQPVDDSLANQAPAQEPTLAVTTATKRKAAPKPVATDEKVSLIKGTDKLRFTFKLTAKAYVQLVAQRRVKAKAKGSGGTSKQARALDRVKKTTTAGKLVTVARSKRELLGKGRHSLTVKLNPKRWPTSIKLNATAWKAPAKSKKLERG